MLKITDIAIDTNKTIGKHLLLVDIIPCYRYDGSNRTNDIESFRYDIVLQDKQFKKLQVKIPGECRIEKPVNYTEVEFKNLELYLYWRMGEYALGAMATDIAAIKSNT